MRKFLLSLVAATLMLGAVCSTADARWRDRRAYWGYGYPAYYAPGYYGGYYSYYGGPGYYYPGYYYEPGWGWR